MIKFLFQLLRENFISSFIGAILGFALCCVFWVNNLREDNKDLLAQKESSKKDYELCDKQQRFLKTELQKADSLIQLNKSKIQELQQELDASKRALAEESHIENIPAKKSFTIWIISEYVNNRNELADTLLSNGFINLEINPSSYFYKKDFTNNFYYREKIDKKIIREIKKYLDHVRIKYGMRKFLVQKATVANGIAQKIFKENENVDILILM